MTPADEVALLRTEVAALRRQVRVLLAAALLVGLLIAFVAVRFGFRGAPGGFVSGEEVRAVQVAAQEYHLVDPDGNLRGMWRCPPAGPSLFLLDEKGRLAVELRQLPPEEAGAVKVMDASGKAARLTTPGK